MHWRTQFPPHTNHTSLLGEVTRLFAKLLHPDAIAAAGSPDAPEAEAKPRRTSRYLPFSACPPSYRRRFRKS